MSTIVTRAGKGSPLTFTEADANFTNLNNDKYQSGASPTFVTAAITTANITTANITTLAVSGSATAPTPSNNDDDTSVATTAFVQAKSRIAPTVQTFTSGSGTYTTPANVKWIKVQMVGGGGGGAGGGTAAWGAGGTGGATTFGTALLSCGGGVGAINYGSVGNAGAASIASPAVGLAINGTVGHYGDFTTPASYASAGKGADAPMFGGGGSGGAAGSAGLAGIANTGGGGGGGSTSSTASAAGGAGGSSGAFIEAIIASPSATYAYAVGAAGSAGAAGTNGVVAGAGAAGKIVVWEFY